MRKHFYTAIFLLITSLASWSQEGPDPDFGNAGVVTTNFGFGATDDMVNTMVIQSDGKIIVAGNSGEFAALARYNSDGSLDNSFGAGGKVVLTSTFSNITGGAATGSITDMVMVSGGKILISGVQTSLSLTICFVIQLMADGSIDPGFQFGISANAIFRNNSLIGLQSDGKIIWATVVSSNIGTNIKRLLSDGTEDLTFTSLLVPDLNTFDVLVLPNDEFLMGGAKDFKFALAKFSADGVQQGITNLTEFSTSTSGGRALALQADGKIVFAGYSITSGAQGYDFAVARFLPDGAIDNSFGMGGKTVTHFAALDVAEGIVIQPDGKIIVAGWRQASQGDTTFASARYLPNGQLDPCYGQAGKLINDLPASMGRAVALQSDGKIVFAGNSGNPDQDFALVRYSANAQPTTWYRDFDGDGYGDDETAVLSCPAPPSEIVKVDPDCVEIFPVLFCETRVVTWVSQGGDCDDNHYASNPGAVEICDEKDNDCDGLIDEDLPTTTYYIDADGDGYGGGDGEEFCNSPGPGYKLTGGDCDDSNPNIYPGLSSSLEVCDGIDNNCDNVIDEGCSGKPTISISNAIVYESEGVAVLTLNLSFITSLQVKINYATLAGTAVSNKKEKDYKSIGNTMLTIPPGTLSTTISVPIYTDNKLENNEYFYVVLSKPTNCILGNVTGMVTIIDGAPLKSVTSNQSSLPVSELESQEGRFTAMVQPNPSTTGFTLNVAGEDDSPVVVNVRNALGQLVQTLRTGSKLLRFGHELKPGFYFVQVLQGNNSKTIKLIKH